MWAIKVTTITGSGPQRSKVEVFSAAMAYYSRFHSQVLVHIPVENHSSD